MSKNWPRLSKNPFLLQFALTKFDKFAFANCIDNNVNAICTSDLFFCTYLKKQKQKLFYQNRSILEWKLEKKSLHILIHIFIISWIFKYFDIEIKPIKILLLQVSILYCEKQCKKVYYYYDFYTIITFIYFFLIFLFFHTKEFLKFVYV